MSFHPMFACFTEIRQRRPCEPIYNFRLHFLHQMDKLLCSFLTPVVRTFAHNRRSGVAFVRAVNCQKKKCAYVHISWHIDTPLRDDFVVSSFIYATLAKQKQKPHPLTCDGLKSCSGNEVTGTLYIAPSLPHQTPCHIIYTSHLNKHGWWSTTSFWKLYKLYFLRVHDHKRTRRGTFHSLQCQPYPRADDFQFPWAIDFGICPPSMTKDYDSANARVLGHSGVAWVGGRQKISPSIGRGFMQTGSSWPNPCCLNPVRNCHVDSSIKLHEDKS